MAFIKKADICASEDMEKREPLYTVGGNVNWCSHCGKQYEGPQKIKNRIIIWPSKSTSGYISKGNKILSQRNICTTMFITALFTIARTQKQPNMVYFYTMKYYLAIKKNEVLPFVTTWMDLVGIMLREVSQTEKDKYCMISLIYEM